MSRKSNRQTQESFRWPALFANPEVPERLFLEQGWQLLEQELREKSETLAHSIVHKLPVTMEAHAEQNFQRGKLAAYEDLLGLREELKEFKNA